MQSKTKNVKKQVKEIKSELSKQFYDAYYSLPVNLYLTVREELYISLYWKPATFYHRLNGHQPIKMIEKSIIEQVFRKYGIEVFKQTA